MAISKSNVCGRILEEVSRLFPDRQIMLRSEGRVSFVTLSKRFQLCAVAAILTWLTMIQIAPFIK